MTSLPSDHTAGWQTAPGVLIPSQCPPQHAQDVRALEASVSSPAEWEYHPSVSCREDEAKRGTAPTVRQAPFSQSYSLSTPTWM